MKRTLGIRMKLAREARGFSQADIATELKISRSAVSQWEADETVPGYDNLEKAANMLDVEVEWLRAEKGRAPDLRGTPVVRRRRRPAREPRPEPPTDDMIPEEVMGIGAAPMILDGRVHDWWRLPPSFVKETLRSEVGVLVFLRVLSDTMHPTIKRGDVVLIDQSQTKPVNDQIFALDNNLGAVLRRVILLPHHGSGELTLRGDQKDVEEVTVKASDVKFIGRCVGAFVIL